MKRLKRKDLLLLANKLIKNIPDPCNAKEHYQSFVRKKIRKSLKQSETITYQSKTFENPYIVDIKTVITEHPKTSHKLFKTTGKVEKVGSNSSLYSDTETWKFVERKFILKQQNEYMLLKAMQVLIMLKLLPKLYFWNSFNPEIQLKDTESAFKSKLIESLTPLKDFKFATTLILVFRKLKSEDKIKYDSFYSSSKAEIITNESNIDDVFELVYTAVITNVQRWFSDWSYY